MRINIVAAVGKNLELGKNNKLIWHISEDLKYFKELTIGKTIVMGEKTYYSIGHPLPNRENIVLSYDNINIQGVTVINNYKDVFSLDKKEIFIVGGSSIYKLFLPYASNIYLTEIESIDKDADCYFPKFNTDLYTKTIIKKSTSKDIKYSFVCYKRKDDIL